MKYILSLSILSHFHPIDLQSRTHMRPNPRPARRLYVVSRAARSRAKLKTSQGSILHQTQNFVDQPRCQESCTSEKRTDHGNWARTKGNDNSGRDHPRYTCNCNLGWIETDSNFISLRYDIDMVNLRERLPADCPP